jgi:hypothetical protein
MTLRTLRFCLCLLAFPAAAQSSYADYRFHFPTPDLARAVGAFSALRTAGLLGAGDLPDNMLGAPITDGGGNEVARGRSGSAPDSDPTQTYIHIRARVTPAQLAAVGFDPTAYGLTVTDPATSASVLGVWE